MTEHDRRNDAIGRPDGWLGNVPFAPEPAPLYVVLDFGPRAEEAPSRARPAVVVRYASFDHRRAHEVEKDWRIAGHEVDTRPVVGGLDEVQGAY